MMLDRYAGTARRGRTARGMGARQGLREQTYAVEVAADGDAAIFEAGTTDYDAIVLDVILPRHDGFTICASVITLPSTKSA